MEILSAEKDRELTLLLRGELDHHGAKAAMTEIGQALDAALPRTLTLDFSGVTFMDSSGIAVVMRAQRTMRAFGGNVSLTRVPPQAKKVFDAAGLTRFVPIR